MSKNTKKNQKKYFIDKHMRCCYPYEKPKVTKEYGVLSEYMDKYYDRDEIDKIICELITRHPYVEGAMSLKISVCWELDGVTGYYHIFDFENDNHDNETIHSIEIKYEK